MLNGRFKKRKCSYSLISNEAIDNDNLSPQSYYIYSKICRYITLADNSDFVLTKSFLFSKCNMSEKTFDKYWKELLNEGYLKIYQIPDKENKGKFLTEYELLEQKNLETPYFIMYKADGTIAKKLLPKPKQVIETNQKDYKKSYGNVQEKAKKTVGVKIGGTVKRKDAKLGGLINTDKINTKEVNINISSSKEDEDNLAKELIAKCSNNNIKISYKQMNTLLSLYDNMKVIKAIEKAIIASEDMEIKRPYNYIATILDNNEKQVVNNINIENNRKIGFNNFTPRARTQEDYDNLEKALLGW